MNERAGCCAGYPDCLLTGFHLHCSEGRAGCSITKAHTHEDNVTRLRPPGNCQWHGCTDPMPHWHIEGAVVVAADAMHIEPPRAAYGKPVPGFYSGPTDPPTFHGATAQQLVDELPHATQAAPLFTRKMIEEATMPTVQVADDGTIYFERKGHSVAESRLIDRRCRCGKHAATTTADGCKWHPSVSAEYAADLLLWVRAQQAAAVNRELPTPVLSGIKRAIADYVDRVRRVLPRD